MKCYYPTDKSGNRIGFKTPEACIYDTSGTNLTNKLNKLRTDVNGKAAASHGNHVPTPQTANNKIYLRNDNTWHTITPSDIGAAASSHSHSWDSITSKPSLYTTSQIDSKVDAINSNIATTKTTIISKFEIVDFSSYIPNGGYRLNKDLTLTIPNISKYQYIRIQGMNSGFYNVGGFTRINSDGTFNCGLIVPYGGGGGYEYSYSLNITRGKVNGNTLTLFAEGSKIQCCGTKNGNNSNIIAFAADSITVESILCMGMK